MSFFGIFASIFSGGVFLTETYNDTRYAANDKTDARRTGRLTYNNGKGNEYLVSTGEKVYTHGGNIYSAKNHTVLHDGWKQYYIERNKKELAEAKEKGKKYALLYYPDSNAQNGYSGHLTELSTMKRYRVNKFVYLNKEINNWDWGFYKVYYNGDNEFGEDSITITRKEYEELGGYIPYISPAEYQKQEQIKREKEFKKMMRRL